MNAIFLMLNIVCNAMMICFLYYLSRYIVNIIRYGENEQNNESPIKKSKSCICVCLDNENVHTSEQNKQKKEVEL